MAADDRDWLERILPSDLAAEFFSRLIFVWTVIPIIVNGRPDITSGYNAATLLLSAIGFGLLRRNGRVTPVTMLIVAALFLHHVKSYVGEFGFLMPIQEQVFFSGLHAFAIGVLFLSGLFILAIWAKLLQNHRKRSAH